MRLFKILIVFGLVLLPICTFAQESEEAIEKKSDKVYMEVDTFPLFSGCDYSDMGSLAEMKACSDEKIIKYITSNITYPKKARRKGVEGVVYVQFVIGPDGAVRDEKIAKEIGGGCGDEVLKMVKKFPNWVPGKMNGKPVSVRYTIPVTFALPKKR